MMNTKTESFTKKIKLIECPRDAMQGLHHFVPTATKINYLNLLLKVGFDTLDFGSFVSPKAIPQMADTVQVLNGLQLTNTKLLAIVANLRGVADACQHEQINYLGFPLSISETFQQRNTNSTIAQSLNTVEEMLLLCQKHNKEAVIYLSMGFGNPYGDEWSLAIVEQRTAELVARGAKIISLADTVGSSTVDQIKAIYPYLVNKFPDTAFGLHLHATPQQRDEKIKASFGAGCLRIDSALKGYGGCPMATDELTGNLATENIINYASGHDLELNLNLNAWQEALAFSAKVFG